MPPLTRARTGKTPVKRRPTSTSPVASPRGHTAPTAAPGPTAEPSTGAAPTMPWKLLLLTTTAASPVVVQFVRMQARAPPPLANPGRVWEGAPCYRAGHPSIHAVGYIALDFVTLALEAHGPHGRQRAGTSI